MPQAHFKLITVAIEIKISIAIHNLWLYVKFISLKNCRVNNASNFMLMLIKLLGKFPTIQCHSNLFHENTSWPRISLALDARANTL